MPELKEPNDLLHFFYKYGVREFPVSKNGEITGKLQKSEIVRFLSRSENFNSNVINTIDKLMEPADESFFEQLKEDLRSGSIKGIPIIREDGEVEQVITPGVLDAREQANEFVDESKKRETYETLIGRFPFPISLRRQGDVIFENEEHEELSDLGGWDSLEWEHGEFSIELFLPDFVKHALDCHRRLRNDEDIEIRDLLEQVESRLMEEAYSRRGSISSASDAVGLPRQTFNYRWNEKHSDNVSSDDE